MPHRLPGSPSHQTTNDLSGKAIHYTDSTVAIPFSCEYAVFSTNSRRPRKEARAPAGWLVVNLLRRIRQAESITAQPAELERRR